MYLTTTQTFEGQTIKEYKGVVFGEVIIGINFMKDFASGITNIVGGRSREYESEIINARTNAINEMSKRAASLGANGVVGISVDCESLSNGMVMVTASGTAVLL
jgi:uncharacterized protein YbjQ (UPF0145 family)